jgi:uncharacterized protein YpuA (DUF1002 family)
MNIRAKKPILNLSDSDREDTSVMIAKAYSVAVENNMDWVKISDQVKEAHENCILLLQLSKHFKIT